MSGTLELGYDYTNNITRAVRVDATGKLEVVSSGGGGGGDATAANQLLQLAQETIIAGDTTSLDTKITACDTGAVVVSSSALPTGASTSALQTTGNVLLTTIGNDTTSLDSKITNGADASLVSAQQVLLYGRDSSGGLDALSVDNAGHLEVVIKEQDRVATIFSGTQVIGSSASHTFATTLDKNGSSIFNLLITSTTAVVDIDYTIEVDTSDDNTTFYTDASAFGPISVFGIQNAQQAFNGLTSRYARITIRNNSPTASLTITSVKSTRINGI